MRKDLLLAALLCLTPALAAGASDARTRRERLSAELEAVARQIELRKAAVAQEGLPPDRELEALLRRSQELAEELAALHRATHEPGPVAGPAEDPQELREQADLLRDQRDRVLSRLATVQKRIDDAREEERVSRAMRDLVDEDELFDESARLMRASRILRRPGSAAPGKETSGGTFDDTEGGGLSPEPSDAPSVPPAGPTTGPVETRSTTVVGTRPLDTGSVGRRLPELQGDESLAELRRQESELRTLAEELERQAAELERRAVQLDAPGAR